MKQLRFRLIKTLDVVYTNLLYLILCLAVSVVSEHLWQGFGDGISAIIGQVSFITGTLYLVRNIIHCIPSPFHNLAEEFDHTRIKELDGGVIAGYALFILCPSLSLKLTKLMHV